MGEINENSLGQVFHVGYPHIFELVSAQLQELKPSELMLVYEMILLIKQPNEKAQNDKTTSKFSFVQAQEALEGISGNLSDDIINIDREERL